MISYYDFEVRGYELDSFNHVNNAVYLSYLESARWDFFHKSGAMDIMKNFDLYPVVLESKIRYIHELKLFDTATVITEWLCKDDIIENKHRIIIKGSGELSAKAKCKIALVSKERIIFEIPQQLKEFLEGE